MTKINLKIGAVEINIEGEENWVSKSYTQILSDLSKLKEEAAAVFVPTAESIDKKNDVPSSSVITVTLPTFLNSKNANKSQNMKFLATAAWLHTKGKQKLTVYDITSTLSQYNQGRLGNPSDVLAQNIGKGFCEKDGKDFYVTPEGLGALDLPSL